ncbi:S9 family peptidase [Fructobacillus sp. M2-14]|uniref:S9 family peptidase n=1 Tax=Fructobacillus broussonetiae TaxID=2713173 RepID=A0ABS5QZG6_9LACO|nr:S9 family peptidase [Fructobacillus broussonetiae]MBS9338162.1 S9 family peptidase [Fructobacillus broussonetiae]
MVNGVQINDLYSLKSLTQPVSVGNNVYFLANRLDKEKDDYQSDIYCLDSKGNVSALTKNGLNTDLIASHDSLFYRHQGKDGVFQIVQHHLTDNTHEIITHGDSVQQIVLNKGQNTIFYKTVREGNDLDDLGIRHVTRVQNSADGVGWLPESNTYSLNRLNLTSGQTETLLNKNVDFSLKAVDEKGASVLYIKAPEPQSDTELVDARGVYRYDFETKQEELITEAIPEGLFTDALFSPDNKQIAIIGSTYKDYSATANQLFVYDVESKKLTNVSPSEDLDIGYGHNVDSDLNRNRSFLGGRWLADGRYLFQAYKRGHSQLYIWDGKSCHLIDNKKRDVYDFSIIDDKSILIATSTPEKASELKHLNLASDQEELLYNANEEYEENHRYAEVEKFSYASKDQLVAIDGWLTKAKTDKKQAPLILYIHGGPHATYGDTFFHEFQALANAGFNVLYTNPRGSLTYGNDFATAVMGHYGEVDYDDVMAGVDYVLDQYGDIIDQKQLYIAGGSYGGFLSTWAISHTDRFKAAIVQRPAINWSDLYLNSDIGTRFVTSELGCDLYKDEGAPAYYWEKSPLAHADKIKTPTRIQHGALDRRCPTSGSHALFRAIKQTGTPCDYILYPDSYHGLSRNGKPSLRIQRLKDIVEWFEKY